MIVTQYSRRTLTRETDKLPALSGLAATFQRAQNLTYMAGVWREDLDSLLWQIDGYERNSDGRVKHKVLLRAPSWSWASIGRNVKWSEIHYREGGGRLSRYPAQVLSVDVYPLGADPMGEVWPGGSITLWAKTWPVKWELVLDDREYGAFPMNCHISSGEPAVLDTVDFQVENDPSPSKECKALHINDNGFLIVIRSNKYGAWRRVGMGWYPLSFSLRDVEFEKIVLI